MIPSEKKSEPGEGGTRMDDGAADGALMAAEMAEQPAVLGRLITRFPEIVASVREVAPRPLAGSVLLGRGSSDNAAVLGRYLVELTSGRPAGLAVPSLTTRYRASVDHDGYLVVALSQSGGTPEIVTTARAIRAHGGRLVVVTNDAASPLATAADVLVATDAGPERAVPATKTVTAQMLVMIGVAAALGELPFDIGDLDALPDAVATLVDAVARGSHQCDRLAQRWRDHDQLVVTGRGLSYAAVLEGALKIRETSAVFAEGISAADLLHGPIAALNARLPVLVVDVGGPSSPDLARLRERLTGGGTPLATLGTAPDDTLSLPAGLPEPLAVIAATCLLQRLAFAFALARGRNPDAPSGLTKVTATH
jgi:glucosamine--fructose-6-phosphate aminotransferase (isomerizing)